MSPWPLSPQDAPRGRASPTDSSQGWLCSGIEEWDRRVLLATKAPVGALSEGALEEQCRTSPSLFSGVSAGR